jgi:signal transduction histidine kinase
MPDDTRRILIVEDEGIIALELAQNLRACGFDVVGSAAEGEPAIELAALAQPDLVLMDISIKGPIDGIEAARRMRLQRDVPVVFLTAYGDSATLERAQRAAPYGYLIKPYRPEELRAVLETALRKHRSQSRSLRAAQEDLEMLRHSVAHNLRAPLRAIDGFAHLLAGEQEGARLGDSGRRLLERVSQSALQMGALVDGLLAFMAVSRRELHPAAVAPDALAREILAERRAEVEGRRAEVLVGVMPTCLADPEMLRAVLEQLVGNALKFSSKRDRPRIEIGACEEDGMTVYYVRDNGVGFDMRHYGKLFGLYESLHAPGEFEGAGVGLAVARRIVERHGGELWAEAVPGAGATFCFSLGAGPRDGGAPPVYPAG